MKGKNWEYFTKNYLTKYGFDIKYIDHDVMITSRLTPNYVITHPKHPDKKFEFNSWPNEHILCHVRHYHKELEPRLIGVFGDLKDLEVTKIHSELNEIHIFNLLEFLHDEVISSCGDGDALWYVRFYDIKEIERLIREYNDENNTGWKVDVYHDYDGNDETLINWGIDQEWVTITDSEDRFNNTPDWQQIKIRH